MTPNNGLPVSLAPASDRPDHDESSPRQNRGRLILGRLIRAKRRAARAIAREGALALTIRKATRAFERLTERARVAWHCEREWMADGRPVFLFISHRCGGGTEQHLRHLITKLYGEGIRVVVVRPGRAGFLLWEERDEFQSVIWCRESSHEQSAMRRLIDRIGPAHVHIHHTLGVPMTLVDMLIAGDISYDWTIHDYYTICPRVNLVDEDHRYCGEPDETGCNQCLSRNGDDQGRPVAISIDRWREENLQRLLRARRILVPSADVRDRVERYFPDLSLLLRPHPETLPELNNLAVASKSGEPVRIAVVGTITAIKGSELLLSCAGDARDRGLALEFHVIGSTDRDAVFSRLGNVRIWGRYKERQVYSRLAAARCQIALLPSLWPETYMYTLSVVMASGLYTVCFDLGAQASRLRAWGWGQVLPLDTSPAIINDTLLAAARDLAAGSTAPSPPPPARYRDVLCSYYAFSPEERDRIVRRSAAAIGRLAETPHLIQRNQHARFH